MAKLGKANVAIVPMVMDDDFPLFYTHNLSKLGYGYRLLGMYDCSNFPAKPKLRSTFDVDIFSSTRVPKPRSNLIDKKLSEIRKMATLKTTRLPNFAEVDKSLSKALTNGDGIGVAKLLIPSAKLEHFMGAYAKLTFLVWPVYLPFLIKLRHPNKAVPDVTLFTVSICASAWVDVFVTGFCRDGDLTMKRGRVGSFEVKPKFDLRLWRVHGFLCNEESENQTSRYKGKSLFSPVIRNRFDAVKRVAATRKIDIDKVPK